MGNIKQVLGLISKKFGDDSPISKALEAEDISEVEFSEDEITQIGNNVSSLLTPDAALNNPDLLEKYKESISPTLKKSIYENVEKELREVGGNFGMKFGEEARAQEMIRKLKEFKPEKPKGNEDLSKYQQEIEQLNAQNSKLREEKDSEISKMKNDFTQKEINQVIERELGYYQLADVYNKDLVKKGIFDNVKNEVFGMASVKVGDTGKIDLYQKDMPDKLIYTEANKPLTFKDFVDPLMKDFVKKQDDQRKKVNFDGKMEKKEEVSYPPNTMMAHLAKERSKAFSDK